MSELSDAVQSLVDVFWGPAPIDTVQELFGADWLRLFEAITLLGEPVTVVTAAAIVLWTRDRGAAYGVLAVVALVPFVNPVLKDLVGLPRPDDPSIVVWHDATQESFPSGHSATAATLWGSLAVLGYLPAAAAAIIIGSVMLSRMYLGVHFLGDVIGGALLGIALAAAFRRLWPAIVRLFSGQPFEFFLALGIAIPLFAWATTGLTSLEVELLGMIVGVGIGMPVERRFVGFAPSSSSGRQTALKVTLGLSGLAVLLLLGSLLDESAPVLTVIVFALAALWVVLFAPAIFVWSGLAGRERSSLADDRIGA